MSRKLSKANAKLASAGERSARRGYLHQDRFSARLIYEAIIDRSLIQVGLADSNAGIFDDLVLIKTDGVTGHQFKVTDKPRAVTIRGLLLDTDKTFQKVANSFVQLRAQFPSTPLKLRYFTNHYASVQDRLVKNAAGCSTSDFLAELEASPAALMASRKWKPLLTELRQSSGLKAADFAVLMENLDLVVGPKAVPIIDPAEDPARSEQIEQLTRTIDSLIDAGAGQDRWSKDEILSAMGWRDRFGQRFVHQISVGAYVQRNEKTEEKLCEALKRNGSGYVALIGPPGAGKSTLLQRELRSGPDQHVARYLAYVAGTAQGQGRGEADNFFDDLSSQLAVTGLTPLRLADYTRQQRQQVFEDLLAQAGKRFADHQTRTIIVVDGLDHVPREEEPQASLLKALPLPQAVPAGVTFVLGSQRVDLKDIPGAVRQQASEPRRLITIDPLPASGVEAMADIMGLPGDVDRQHLFETTQGHPLVTRFVIEQLKASEPAERDTLLHDMPKFSGDLQAVYESAWRAVEASTARDGVNRVLALLAFAQGPIEPALLAQAVSTDAVEQTYSDVGHLLNTGGGKWSAFHNSFRLFIRDRPVERFGQPDPAYTPQRIYERLAELATLASRHSVQRWLRFRYLYLAGDNKAALELASRSYFIEQYINGRSASAVIGDINDAYRLVATNPDAAKLLSLMLAHDEVFRRADVTSMVPSLAEAYIAVGDLASAERRLQDDHPADDNWTVIDALLEPGQFDRARDLFEGLSPFPTENRIVGWDDRYDHIKEWAERAIIFLDDDQIESRIQRHLTSRKRKQQPHEKPEQLRASAKFQVARALARAEGGQGIQDIIKRWSVPKASAAILQIEGALSALRDGDNKLALKLLAACAKKRNWNDYHASWPLAAAKSALKLGHPALARKFVGGLAIEGLSENDKLYHSGRIANEARLLLDQVVVRTWLGQSLPQVQVAKEPLITAVQNRLIELGTLIGQSHSGQTIARVTVEQAIVRALRFLGSISPADDHHYMIAHLVPKIAEAFADAFAALLSTVPAAVEVVASQFDQQIEQGARFAHWLGFRRQMIVLMRTYQQDGSASERLEKALAALEAQEPQEEQEELSRFAIAFAEIGATERGKAIMDDLRAKSLGVYVAAKKDAQYAVWSDLLVLANSADPAGRRQRVDTALRLLDGLHKTTGYDMAARVARQFLLEASLLGPAECRATLLWAACIGVSDWGALIDTGLRSVVDREPGLANIATLAWSQLALPWYFQNHGSTLEVGGFLRDAIGKCDAAGLMQLEATLSAGIAELAQPDEKLKLLRIAQEAFRDRGYAAPRIEADRLRWADCEFESNKGLDDRDYGALLTIEQLSDAYNAEKAFAAADPENRKGKAPSYDLRMQSERILASGPWPQVDAFASQHPEFIAAERRIAEAAAKVGVAAGDKNRATELLEMAAGQEREGWSWMSGKGRLHHHQRRKILGEADAVELARREFLFELNSSRWGIGPVIWEMVEIFPLIFDDVDWPGLWAEMEPQLRAMREYPIGALPEPVEHATDDEGLIASLLCWALLAGVPMVQDQAIRVVSQILGADGAVIIHELVTRLFDRGGEADEVAIRILARSVDSAPLRELWAPHLALLVDHSDIAVAANALWLATKWSVNVQPVQKPVPAFYSLILSEPSAAARTIADPATRGMVVEDPWGWTRGFDSIVKLIAKMFEVTDAQVKMRAHQLIDAWGGLAKFGDQGSKGLERQLKTLGLVVSYRRPQAEVSLRALRYVACELWHSLGCADYELRLLLQRLRAEFDPAEAPEIAPRPRDVQPYILREFIYGEKLDAWMSAVADDVQAAPEPGALILAEWRRYFTQETHEIMERSFWIGPDNLDNPAATIEDHLDALPQVVKSIGLFPLYRADEERPFAIAQFDPGGLSGPSGYLIFCPHLAEELRWKRVGSRVDLYVDVAGQEMARTEIWREGLRQSQGSKAHWAYGQRILLSEAGKSQLEAKFGPIIRDRRAWRHVDGTSRGVENKRNYAQLAG